MKLAAVLTDLQRLYQAAEHPDIVDVSIYGAGEQAAPWGPDEKTSKVRQVSGIRVRHQSTATAMLAGKLVHGWKPGQLPEVLPAPKGRRAPRLVALTVRLLEVAQPSRYRSWQPVLIDGIGAQDAAELPYGIRIEGAGGTEMILHAMATGATVGSEPDEDPFPDYVVPAGVKGCLG